VTMKYLLFSIAAFCTLLGCAFPQVAGTADDVNSGSIIGSILRDPRSTNDTVVVCLYSVDSAKALGKRHSAPKAALKTLKITGDTYRFDSLASGAYRIRVLCDSIVVGKKDALHLESGKIDTINISVTLVVNVMLSVQSDPNISITGVSIDNGKSKKLESGYVLTVAAVDTQSFEIIYNVNGVSSISRVQIALNGNETARFKPLTDSTRAMLTPSFEPDCLVPGAIACLPFDGGQAIDASGNNNHGRVVGAVPTTDRYGRPNAALIFNGKDNYVIVDTLRGIAPGNSPKSISGWFRCEHFNKYLQMLFGFGTTEGSYNFQIGVGPLGGGLDTPYVFRVNGWGDSYDWRTGIPAIRFFDGQWHHCVLSYDGTAMRLYFDGSLAQQTLDFHYNTPTVPVLVIGNEIDLNEWEFDGALDDIRIFNRAIDANEVKLLFNQTSEN
jgi:hypothetical protein